MTGKVKSFNYKSGYGFIGLSNGQEDIFVGREQLPAEWQATEMRIENLDVAFDMNTNPDGKTRARSVRPALPPKGGSLVSGIVKSWNPIKGFGFFQVDRLDHDVFFTKDRIPLDFRGAQLDNFRATFTLQQKPDGKYEAVSLTFVDQIRHGGTGYDSRGNGTGGSPYGGNSYARNVALNDVMAPNKKHTERLLEGRVYTGQVKSFSERNNYGFIVCPQSYEDVMFHGNDIVTKNGPNHPAPPLLHPSLGGGASISPGVFVSFTCKLSPQGRVQAQAVTVIEDAQYLRTYRKQTSNSALLDEVKGLSMQLNPADLSEMAFFVTRMLQNKLRN